MTDARAALRIANRLGRLLGLTAAALALVLFALLHVLVSRLSPVTDTISDYALSSGGWIFDTAVLVLAASSVCLLGPLLWRRQTAVPLATACYACWCLGLVVLTVFPRDPVDAPVTATGEIHKWASVAALLSLPLGALLTARRRRGPGARVVAVTAAVCLVALVPFVTAYLASSPLKPYLGLVERAVALGEVILLLLLGTIRLGLQATTQLTAAGSTPGVIQPGSRSRQRAVDGRGGGAYRVGGVAGARPRAPGR
ncbi:DUF998 domain-containing protein [Micromonospora sp. DR5-3]|uniref:DUF998 domain-containing protein n=1 Tax=unclassified Micromonospora TaxID=2617518 RepID=UPI0011D82FB8|nr:MULTISPECIES: DUF998 domain-containing protein [unclassified Micromonospora]MCW3814079.1 DUF998 domain-containing protein [Micromonospora sp. DR5-3]TYC23574.1 DUF998 domain-containing protein [Micromonospora sp. MP36]